MNWSNGVIKFPRALTFAFLNLRVDRKPNIEVFHPKENKKGVGPWRGLERIEVPWIRELKTARLLPGHGSAHWPVKAIFEEAMSRASKPDQKEANEGIRGSRQLRAQGRP